MGNGQGVSNPFIFVHGSTWTIPSRPQDVDPFVYHNQWNGHMVTFTYVYGSEEVESIKDTRSVVMSLAQVLFRLKIFDRETAWDFIESDCGPIVELGERIRKLSLPGRAKELRKKMKAQKKLLKKERPTWDRAQQYKPTMKGKSYGRNKR